ncbi:NAD-dependent epimerase/dehydratase family protein [Amycolatopsis sp. RTGN1]|uniref:NAD-dependent epimerase/dehydratase family protein n=1 Tax=Amycolatopsis ponsaeliensis TaxID=2992142 RepID=UPI00254E83D3|nr:NAD-dependent epimerase/dehydratase family protein [Amycolatopsis sp. RTGN1]
MTAAEPDILIAGATGFVGTAVLRELVGRGMGPRVRVLVRRPAPQWMTDAGVTPWTGDVTDASSLAGLCTGIRTLVHLASQVGGDPAGCTAVNEGGTANLLAEARRAGTKSVLYLSTCAVYRDGAHRGAPVPGERAPAGRSGLGAGSGLTADQGVSAGGGSLGGGSELVANQGAPTSWRGSAEGVLLGGGSAGECTEIGHGLVAEQGPPTSRNGPESGGLRGRGSLTGGDGSAGSPGAGSGLMTDPAPLTSSGPAGECPGAESGAAADLGPSATRTGPAGEHPNAEPVTDRASPPGRTGLAREHLRAGSGLVTGPAAPPGRSGSGGGYPHPGPVMDPASPPGRTGLASGDPHPEREPVTDPASPPGRSGYPHPELVTDPASPPARSGPEGDYPYPAPAAPTGRLHPGLVMDPASPPGRTGLAAGDPHPEPEPVTDPASPTGLAAGDPHPEPEPVTDPHSGPELVLDPASPTSRSRLAGERLVLAAGGTVLRPHLVHGPGDRHVVPALVRWIQAVPAWAEGGTARTSLVAVADLAAAIAVLALDPGLSRPGEVFHVADPRPVRIRGLVTAVCALLDLPLPATDLPLAEHRARTRAALPSLTDHQYSLLTRDHWYESSRIWELTGVTPRPRLAEAADWYRASLGR